MSHQQMPKFVYNDAVSCDAITVVIDTKIIEGISTSGCDIAAVVLDDQ